jgi:methionine-rich copper-binding protein CopC
LVALFGLIGLAVAEDGAIPGIPASYYGSVKKTDGGTVASGRVEAYIDGVKRGELDFTNGYYGSEYGGLKLPVQGPDEINGKTVTFKVVTGSQSYDAEPEQTVTMAFEDIREVNLKVNMGTAAPVPPSVTAADPYNNAYNVALDKTITVTFSTNIQEGAAYDSISITGGTVTFTKSISGSKLIIDPAANFSNGVKYKVTIPAGAVKDSSGTDNTLYYFSFTTVAASTSTPTTPTGLNVSGADPADGAVNVQVNKTISIFFNNTVSQGSAYSSISMTDAQGAAVNSTKSISGNTLIIDPAADLTSKTTYKVTVPASALRDSSGNNNDSLSLTFTTADSSAATTPSTTPGTTPTGGGTVTFTDLEGHWSKDISLKLAEQGLIKGYPDNTFGPDNVITRVEAVAILVRALKLDTKGESELAGFVDSGEIPAWARGSAAAAVRAGLVKGATVEGGLAFRPNSPVTRVELASIIARIINQKLTPTLVPLIEFPDNGEIPSWAKSDINLAAYKEIVKGYPDGTFQPARQVTRAEAGVMISGLLKLLS